MWRNSWALAGAITAIGFGLSAAIAAVKEKPKPYRLPSVDLKQRIVWGSEATSPDGFSLAFGGQDQKSDDGIGHTRIKEKGGEWKDISEELRKGNPYQSLADEANELARRIKDFAAKQRALLYEGQTTSESTISSEKIEPLWRDIRDRSEKFNKELEKTGLDTRRQLMIEKIRGWDLFIDYFERKALGDQWIVSGLWKLESAQHAYETKAKLLSAEPSPRALSPVVYEPKSKLFVLVGGDHLDYLTNDTWTFDPATRKWTWLDTLNSPPPRANHKLEAKGDGKIVLRGGYTYANNFDYMGGQFVDLADGEWTYEVGGKTWSNPTDVLETGSVHNRVYRNQAFSPLEFATGQKPNAAAFAEVLKKLPENQWVNTKPAKLPQLQRDWGSAIIDPDRDLILRWSGGHCAHGGSDVLHFHLASNSWELTNPVEFPLGQLYTNTEYPDGFNFNRRPWVTGHTYQSYGYDVNLKQMLFLGRETHTYAYEPDRADWGERWPKPEGLAYGSAYYTITCTSTPHGLFAWTQRNQLFQFDAKTKTWAERKLTGEKLQGSVVDNSTMLYDSKRDRLLCCRKEYGDKTTYNGTFQAIDLATNQVSTVAPAGKEAASAISYLCQLRYDPEHDMVLCGCTLEPGSDGLRRTPAYDCAAGRWVSFKITGDDPSGPKGRNVSLGLVYDAKRKLFWAVDTHGNVFVLRFNPQTADAKELGGTKPDFD